MFVPGPQSSLAFFSAAQSLQLKHLPASDAAWPLGQVTSYGELAAVAAYVAHTSWPFSSFTRGQEPSGPQTHNPSSGDPFFSLHSASVMQLYTPFSSGLRDFTLSFPSLPSDFMHLLSSMQNLEI